VWVSRPRRGGAPKAPLPREPSALGKIVARATVVAAALASILVAGIWHVRRTD
jgi:hypothetical protein